MERVGKDNYGENTEEPRYEVIRTTEKDEPKAIMVCTRPQERHA